MAEQAKQIKGRVKSRFNFLRETVAELKKVTWLPRREVIHLTVLVLVVTVVMGLILGGIDYGFSYLINLFIK